MDKKVIVFGADIAYKEQVLTTIKSICRFNQNIKFYLINRDFDSDWFIELNDRLLKYDSLIEDVKIKTNDIDKFKTYSHISPATYFRYFIPEKIEEDKVLYLDSDLIVRGNLEAIFNINIEEYGLAATLDMICENCDENTNEFNAGVILINNKKWKEYRVLEKAMNIHFERDKELKNADQSVLNILFDNDWMMLDRRYNYQVGVEYIRKLERNHRKCIRVNNPLIVHFTTANKPWKHASLGIRLRFKLFSVLSLREFIFGKVKIEYEKEWFNISKELL